MFFGSMTLLEGKSVNDAKERISEVRPLCARCAVPSCVLTRAYKNTRFT